MQNKQNTTRGAESLTPSWDCSLPSLTPQIETSQRSQWFRKQKARPHQIETGNALTDIHYTDSDDSISRILESNQRNDNKSETNRQRRHKTQNTNYIETSFVKEIKTVIEMIIPQILKLVFSDHSTKIEAILEIANIFELQGAFEETIAEMRITSRIDE